MLPDDCAHLEPTKCQHLPVEFFDAYRRYKIGTRAVVAWLIRNGSCDCPRSNAVSVRDLKKFADIIRNKAIVMPEDILFQLRETILARGRLSKFFKKCSEPGCNQDDNDAHEFFTTILEQILHDFSYQCFTVAPSQKADVKVSLEEVPESPVMNRFEVLNLYSPQDVIVETNEDVLVNIPRNDSAIDVTSQLKKGNTPCVTEDSIGDAATLLQIAQDMHNLTEIACETWAEAARGEIPAVAAALLTNASYSQFDDIECRFIHVLDSSDPDTLQETFLNLERQFKPSTASEDSIFAEFEAIAALKQPWALLQKLKNDRRPAADVKPLTFESVAVNVNPGTNAERDHTALLTLVANVNTLITLPEVPDPVIRLSTPIFAEIGFFCTRPDYEKVSLRCAYGLRLMLETFKSQLRQSRILSQRTNYRLKSLQLAQQAIKSLGIVLEDPTMPCRCPQTLALALQSVQEDLQKFTRRMVFDLFFQTPWVASSHMLEIMDVMFFYGIRLVTYRHYVGSVLHIYNALRTLTEMQPIPLLDALCENLSKVVFPGCQPKRNFRSSYTRFMGGRLNVKLHKQRHKAGSGDGAWHMTIPKDMARTASGLGMRDALDDPRFDYKKLSVFYYVKQKKYCIDDHVREQCHRCAATTATPGSNTTKPHPCSHSSSSAQTSPRESILGLKAAILKDFSGPLPLAQTNFCAVYLACVRIVTLISDRWHEDSDTGKRCLCFVDMLLGDADMRQLEPGRVLPARHRAVWKICQEVITEVLALREMKEFLFLMD